MTIERYLCVGGTEVANPNRTLAYLRAMGNPCLPYPPGDGCCTCPDWQPTEEEDYTCGASMNLDLSVVGGSNMVLTTRGFPFPVPGPETWDYTVPWQDRDCPPADAGEWTIDVRTLEYAPGSTKPDQVPYSDPSWVDLAVDAAVTAAVAVPYPDGVHPVLVQVVWKLGGAPIFEHGVWLTEGVDGVGSWGTGVWGFGAPYGTFQVPVNAWSPIPGPFTGPGAQLTFGGAYNVPFTRDVPVPFTNPTDDDAPWYDPNVEASADVLGVWLEQATLGTSHERQARGRRWGSTLGPTQHPGRELTLVGWVYTRTEAASAYARQWLYEALQGGLCSGGNCELPDAEVWTHCNPEVPDEGARTLKRVGLTGWNPELEPEFPKRCGFKFEAVLTAEVPHLVTAPFDTVEATLADGDELCLVCNPCPTPEPPALTCGCMDTPLREVPRGDVAACYCAPIQVWRTFVATETPRYWTDAVAIITVDVGDPDTPGGEGLANLRIRGWVNPVGLTAPDDDGENPFECQTPCLDVEVGCVPPRSQLVIDGATRRATLHAEGMSTGAYGYLSSGGGQRLSWPEVSCHGLMLCVDADAQRTPANATVTVELVHRERG